MPYASNQGIRIYYEVEGEVLRWRSSMAQHVVAQSGVKWALVTYCGGTTS